MAFEGNWQLMMDSPMGKRPASLSIREVTGSLEGALTTGMGTASVSGRADGSSVEFNAPMQGPMGVMDLAFTGTVNGGEASGQVQRPRPPRQEPGPHRAATPALWGDLLG